MEVDNNPVDKPVVPWYEREYTEEERAELAINTGLAMEVMEPSVASFLEAKTTKFLNIKRPERHK